MKQTWSFVDAIIAEEKPRYYNEKQKQRSRAQAKTDASLQARAVANRQPQQKTANG